MRKLLVASVFAPHEHNATWYRLQRQFLDRTTGDYDHAVYLKRIPESERSMFDDSILVGADDELSPEGISRDHQEALAHLIAYCKAHEYEHYLLLDSDAWPIRKGWLMILDDYLRERERVVAAPVRTENLDLFFHPCVVYVRGSYMPELAPIGPADGAVNLLGDTYADTAVRVPRERAFPLLRTNTYNPHPVFAAVYHHLFYHHGSGSRDPVGRAISRYRYFRHFLDDGAHARIAREIYEALVRDPEGFIASLTVPPRRRWWKRS